MKVGTRLRSAVSTAEVVVIRAPESDFDLRCGGVAMVQAGQASAAATSSEGPEILLGKRYVDEEAGLEVLCAKPGVGPLTLDGRELAIKSAKQLPASD